MNETEIVERVARVEERGKSNSHRLDKLEPIVEEIHTMSKTMVQLTSDTKQTRETVAEIKDHVEEMEREPAKRWQDSTKALFNAALGAIGTAIGGAIIFALTNR